MKRAGGRWSAGIWLVITASACSETGPPTQPAGAPAEPIPPASIDLSVRAGSWPDGGDGRVGEIPTEVHSIEFRVIGPGDVELTEAVAVSPDGGAPVATFDVEPGAMHRFDATARDVQGNLLHRGVIYRRVAATDDSLRVDLDVHADDVPPPFDGPLIASSIGANEIEVRWAVADPDSLSPEFRYLVWLRGPAGRSDGLPVYASSPGESGTLLTGVLAATTYEITVRAHDPAGNLSAPLTAATTTFGRDYGLHVDVENGRDNPGCGGPDNPCQTITRALLLTPGHEPIYVESGTYSGATGEALPLILKPGTRLIGRFDYVGGVPLTVIESDDGRLPLVRVTNEGAITAVRFVHGATNQAGDVIDARRAETSLDRVHVDGRDVSPAIGIAVGEAPVSIRRCRIYGFAHGTGLYMDGSTPARVWSCVVERCEVGIRANGDDLFVANCRIRENVMGVVAWALPGEDSSHLRFWNNLVQDNRGNGFNLERVRDTELTYNLVHRNGQIGVLLAETDSTVRISSGQIDSNHMGVMVWRGTARIEQASIVCNGVNLFVMGERVDVRRNRWDEDPPTLRSINWGQDEECGDTDICYDGDYTQTPVPLWEPSIGTASCLQFTPGSTWRSVPVVHRRVPR